MYVIKLKICYVQHYTIQHDSRKLTSEDLSMIRQILKPCKLLKIERNVK